MMALFDLLGRSWAMGIIWNLNDGPATFRGLQAKCETVSPSALNSRLKELRETGIIARTDEGYALTALGAELFATLKPVAEWSWKWAKTIKE